MLIAMLFIMVEKLETIKRFKNRDPLNKPLCSILTALEAAIKNSPGNGLEDMGRGKGEF